MAFKTLFLIFILNFIHPLTSKTVSNAVIHFRSVQEGDAVHLDINTTELHDFEELDWVKNDIYILVSYIKSQTPMIHGTVGFNKETFSLTLMNTWRNDSGLYKARANIEGSEKTLCLYNVSVFGAVSQGSTTISIHLSRCHSCIMVLSTLLVCLCS